MEVNLERNPGQISFSYGREFKTISKSAPLLPENKLNPAGRLSQLQPSPSYKFTSYVLPTPVETKDPVLKESNINTRGSQLSPPFSDGRSSKRFDPSVASNFSSSGSILSSGYPPFSGSLLRTPLSLPTSSPKLSSIVSPTFVSSPKISELHELSLLPAHLAYKIPSNRIAHSGPLVPKEASQTSKMTDDISSPPLTPISLPDHHPLHLDDILVSYTRGNF
ncbi:Hypothetical predicted protein [Olea europaea subsp. europaea]|uniref:Uncharacterized protein n=1 Tax=Olea europaea subsp. europaea TaxID=158383 RepID=A0A8S0UES5_OLEEU|nr:Hypothetical predicted protein [Olea europaea subsp. europaea]